MSCFTRTQLTALGGVSRLAIGMPDCLIAHAWGLASRQIMGVQVACSLLKPSLALMNRTWTSVSSLAAGLLCTPHRNLYGVILSV